MIFIPLIASIILAVFLRGEDRVSQNNAKWLALVATVATFLASIFLYAQFDSANTGFQFVEDRPWFAGLRYKLGVDGISVLFVLLTTFLMPIVIASCWEVDYRVKDYMIALLLLETLMLGVFCALDIIFFYLSFEAGLFPVVFIIGIWGGGNRVYAFFKFFLYPFLGSVLLLFAIISMFI